MSICKVDDFLFFILFYFIFHPTSPLLVGYMKHGIVATWLANADRGHMMYPLSL
jgi:hypothetical protein